MEPLLSIRNLTVRIDHSGHSPLESLGLDLQSNEFFGLVGESGSGKSLTGLSILRLLAPGLSVERGSISFRGKDILQMSEEELCEVRGGKIAMIFQEPMSALNPVFSVGKQIEEVLRFHRSDLDRAQRRQTVVQLLQQVGIPAPEERQHAYPHELSGGMRQRAMIAMALGCQPDLLIADEPTTSLDVTIQAQILRLLKKIQVERKMSVLLVSHDLALISQVCDRTAVMYCGQVVELGETSQVLKNPRHPYTQGLLRSVPKADRDRKFSELPAIPGQVPTVNEWTKACRFANRCSYAQPRCRDEMPALTTQASSQFRCHFPIGMTDA